MLVRQPSLRAIFAFALLARISAPAYAERVAPCGIAIVGATLIDGNGGPALADATVIVRDGVRARPAQAIVAAKKNGAKAPSSIATSCRRTR